VYLCGYETPTFTNCTFVGNDVAVRAFIDIGDPTFERCILAFSNAGPGVEVNYSAAPTMICCDIYGNAGGDWVGPMAAQLGERGNFSADPLFCDLQQDDYHLWNYSPCVCGPCGLVGAYPVGCTDPQGLEAEQADAARGRILERACPNPMRGSVRIECRLGESAGEGGPVSLEIFDSTGRFVRSLGQRPASPGRSFALWDGRNAQGRPAAPGAYFCRLKAGDAEDELRLVLLR
jgi:hypothetical protein